MSKIYRLLAIILKFLHQNPLKYENGELDKYKTKDKNEYFYKLIAEWNPDLLKFEKEYRELTDVEKEKYNGYLVDELEVE